MKFILFCALLSMAKCIDILDDLLTNLNSNAFFDDLLDFAKDDSWESFKGRYGKNYSNQEEEAFRKQNFQRNLKRASEHNAKQSNYSLGVNKYSDLSPEEAHKQLMGYKGYNNHTSTASPYPKAPQAVLPAPTVDWRTKGYVTPVKDQGSCGSCYSFSATGALEGQVKRKTGKLVSLSEQNLIDCSTLQGNGGCDGGWMIQAFKYVQSNNGIDTEKAYPYIQDEGLTCTYSKAGKGANCTGYVEVPTGDEKALMKTVEQIGPVSVAVNADDDFTSYKDGIYDRSPCPNTIDDLTHAVLVVGYGTENGTDYWLVKNSWGTTWGLDGYIKMVRNKNNTCGIATKASYPLVV